MKKRNLIQLTTNRILIITAKYIFIILAVIFYIPEIGSKITEPDKINAFDLITTLLPMIVSTVTIALSLQDNDIYGMSNFKFRRLRKGFTFDFLEMVLIVISILTLSFVSKFLGNETSIFYLNIISIFYSIWFAIQEIPILTRNDKYLMRVVKRIYENNLSKNYQKGKDSSGYDFDEILTYLIFHKGLIETYSYLEIEDTNYDVNLMEHLLSLAIKQMKAYQEDENIIKDTNNVKYLKKTLNDTYFIMDGLCDIFSNFQDISIKNKFNDSNITNLIVELTTILKSLSIIFNKEEHFSDSLLKIFDYINNRGKDYEER